MLAKLIPINFIITSSETPLAACRKLHSAPVSPRQTQLLDFFECMRTVAVRSTRCHTCPIPPFVKMQRRFSCREFSDGIDSDVIISSQHCTAHRKLYAYHGSCHVFLTTATAAAKRPAGQRVIEIQNELLKSSSTSLGTWNSTRVTCHRVSTRVQDIRSELRRRKKAKTKANHLYA
jgi:hypothetical protein